MLPSLRQCADAVRCLVPMARPRLCTSAMPVCGTALCRHHFEYRLFLDRTLAELDTLLASGTSRWPEIRRQLLLFYYSSSVSIAPFDRHNGHGRSYYGNSGLSLHFTVGDCLSSSTIFRGTDQLWFRSISLGTFFCPKRNFWLLLKLCWSNWQITIKIYGRMTLNSWSPSPLETD